jgi:hypothetical protein
MTPLIVRAARPAWMALPGAAVATAVIGLLTAVVTAAFGDGTVSGLGWWSVVAVGALVAGPAIPIVGLALLRRRHRRLELDDTVLTHVDDWGRRTAVPRERISSVYRVPLLMNIEYGEVTVVADRRDRALISLWHKHWDAGQLDRVWSALGRPSVYYRAGSGTGAYRAAEARAALPGLWLPLPFTRPFAVAGVAVALVLIYLAGWIAVMVSLTA